MMKKILILTFLLAFFTVSVCAQETGDAVENYYGNKIYYKDLQNFKWAEPAIYHLAEYGLISDENGYVYPQKSISRAEFTKLVVGAFGLYDFDAQCNFKDVDKNSEYYTYIASAYELGIIKGVQTDLFGMEENLLRQDMATIIYRTAILCGVELAEKPVLDFADADMIDAYAREAVAALTGAKAVSGNLDYQFLPKNKANFAEACKILYYIMLKNT